MLWYDIQSHKWIDMISHDVIWYQKSLNWYVMIFSGGLGRESREWCDWRRVAFARWDHQVIVCEFVGFLSEIIWIFPWFFWISWFARWDHQWLSDCRVCLFGPSGDCLSSVCDQECLSGHDNEKDNLILLHNWTRKTIGRLLVCGSVCLSGPDMVQTGWDGCRQTKNSLISGEQHFPTGNARVSSLSLLWYPAKATLRQTWGWVVCSH